MKKKDNSEKRHKCEQCEYATSRASHLKRHVLGVHKKLKNFKCEKCEYAASQAGDLKKHVLLVHDKIKSYKCEQWVP